jgi:hypothetical protein
MPRVLGGIQARPHRKFFDDSRNVDTAQPTRLHLPVPIDRAKHRLPLRACLASHAWTVRTGHVSGLEPYGMPTLRPAPSWSVLLLRIVTVSPSLPKAQSEMSKPTSSDLRNAPATHHFYSFQQLSPDPSECPQTPSLDHLRDYFSDGLLEPECFFILSTDSYRYCLSETVTRANLPLNRSRNWSRSSRYILRLRNRAVCGCLMGSMGSHYYDLIGGDLDHAADVAAFDGSPARMPSCRNHCASPRPNGNFIPHNKLKIGLRTEPHWNRAEPPLAKFFGFRRAAFGPTTGR